MSKIKKRTQSEYESESEYESSALDIDKDVIYIPPLKKNKNNYNTRYNNKIEKKRSIYKVTTFTESTGLFRIEVRNTTNDFITMEYIVNKKGNFLLCYDKQGKVIRGYNLLLDSLKKTHTVYLFENVGYNNYISFWTHNNYGHYFIKENPKHIVQYSNIIKLIDDTNNLYLGQHIIINKKIICHGKGLLQYNIGEQYIGNLNNHCKNGYGINIIKKEETGIISIWEGMWKDNKFIKGINFRNDGFYQEINNV
jgi:hypothetical protein